jgi:single-strand DNA-binding protein
MSGNSITIVGNVTRDPELRFTPNGQAQARLGVAVNRRWQDRSSGEWQEKVSFFDVVCWADMAENAASSLKKGARVIVTGRLEQRSYETKEGDNTVKRSVVEIIADEIAPSLRWATAKVEKTERRGGDQGGGGGGSGFGRSAPAAEQPAPYDDFGDEPF